jgi:AraC-like DNA-binding protein
VNYQERAPTAWLASIVQCIWTLEGDAAELRDEQPVLPDGRPELVIHLGDPFDRIRANGESDRQPALLFAGQLIEPLVLRPTGRIAVVGFRFHPYGAAALSARPQRELVGQTTTVDELAPGLRLRLNESCGAAPSLTEAANALEGHLARIVRHDRIDPRIVSAVNTIRGRRGRVSIQALAARVGMTRRSLERSFRDLIGVSPKRLARIERVQHALRLLEPAQRRAGARIAAECGYADQAHFIRECRELCGHPPAAHLLERAALTGLFLA